MSGYKPPQRSNASDEDNFAANYFALRWPHDAEDYFHRQAARIIAANGCQKTLLVRGHDFSDSTRWWWSTVGGGMEPGETPREATVREFFEEIGHRLKAKVLTGPVLHRHTTFDFHQLTCKQDEDFLFMWISSALQFSRAFEIEAEEQMIDELKWWDLMELKGATTCGTMVYPLNFVSLVRRWLRGWNRKAIGVSEGTVLLKR